MVSFLHRYTDPDQKYSRYSI